MFGAIECGLLQLPPDVDSALPTTGAGAGGLSEAKPEPQQATRSTSRFASQGPPPPVSRRASKVGVKSSA